MVSTYCLPLTIADLLQSNLVEAHSYVLNKQGYHFRVIFVATVQFDAGCFDPKIFINCSVQMCVCVCVCVCVFECESLRQMM